MKVVVTITSMLFQRLFIHSQIRFVPIEAATQQHKHNSMLRTVRIPVLYYCRFQRFWIFAHHTHIPHHTIHHLNNHSVSHTLISHAHTHTHSTTHSILSLHMTMPKSQNAKLPGNVNELALYLLLLLLPLLELLLLLLRFSVLSVRCYFSRVS